jgi:hypothetical protein
MSSRVAAFQVSLFPGFKTDTIKQKCNTAIHRNMEDTGQPSILDNALPMCGEFAVIRTTWEWITGQNCNLSAAAEISVDAQLFIDVSILWHSVQPTQEKMRNKKNL